MRANILRGNILRGNLFCDDKAKPNIFNLDYFRHGASFGDGFDKFTNGPKVKILMGQMANALV